MKVLLSFFMSVMLMNTAIANQPDVEILCSEDEDIVLSTGQYAICSFETRRDEDIAYVNLRAGELVSISVLRSSSYFGISFHVFTEDNVLVVNKPSYQHGMVTFKAPYSGQYMIKIQGRYIETYTLQVNSLSSTLNENPLDFEMHHNLIDYKNDYDFFKFYAEAGSSIQLELLPVQFSGLSAKVFTSDGIEISSIPASSIHKTATMDFTNSDFYYIQMVAKQALNYSIQLTCLSEYCPESQEPQPFTPDFNDGLLYCLEDVARCSKYFGL